MDIDFYRLSTWVLPVLAAITLHEAAHGFVAWRLGDDTARRLGRVTFNPFRHIDPLGTIVVPALLAAASPFVFGWAKPVPVNFAQLKDPRRDMVWVAAAGPAVNLVLAALSAAAIHLALLLPGADWLTRNLVNSMIVNLVLAVFNMLPVPPLDGGRVVAGLLPPRLGAPLARLERFGLFLIVGILFVLPLLGAELGLDLHILPWLVGGPVELLFRATARAVGL